MWKPTPPKNSAYKHEVFTRAAKVTDFIYQIGDTPSLREPSKHVPIKDIPLGEIQQKIRYLQECLRRYRRITGYGRGITGVQVGIPERISVVYTPEMDMLTLINPEITDKSSTKLWYPEICMSANPIIAPVTRPAWVQISYYDETGKRCKWNTTDKTPEGRMMNRVLQHEIDHCNGIINIDLVRDPKELILESDPAFYESVEFEEA